MSSVTASNRASIQIDLSNAVVGQFDPSEHSRRAHVHETLDDGEIDERRERGCCDAGQSPL